MVWFLVLLSALLAPLSVQAEALPQPSDVIFLHDGITADKQDSYNYIFTVDGDDTIYTCQANRCSVLAFRDQPTVNITFYQLPEGFQRVASIVNQTVLLEYRTAAVASYRFEGLETELAATTTTRSYHTVSIHSDGSYDRDTTSQERNSVPVTADASTFSFWGVLAIGIGIFLIVGVVGFVLWKRRR